MERHSRPTQTDDIWRELQPLLDREVHRLPDKYRVPVVLCELEGRPRKEVARQLALPEGTLSSRLATARRLLGERLTRRGVQLSGATLALALSQRASADVPAALIALTLRNAAAAALLPSPVDALTGQVLHALAPHRLKLALPLLLAACVVVTGLGALTFAEIESACHGRTASGGQSDGDRRGPRHGRRRLIRFSGSTQIPHRPSQEGYRRHRRCRRRLEQAARFHLLRPGCHSPHAALQQGGPQRRLSGRARAGRDERLCRSGGHRLPAQHQCRSHPQQRELAKRLRRDEGIPRARHHHQLG